VLEGRVKITIRCGEVNIHAEHPLFNGGLCKECKVRGRRDLVVYHKALPCLVKLSSHELHY
jgi:hypothetical protein